MRLNIEDWKEFKIGRLFAVEIAKSEDLGNLEDGNVPFVGRTKLNNGLQAYVKSNKITKGNCISVSLVGTNVALWQKDDFVASQNIATLRNNNINEKNALFISSLVNHDMKYKFSYGRTVTKKLLEDLIIKLPICRDENNEPIIDTTKKYSEEGYIPDFGWTENYIKSLKHKPLTTENKKGKSLALNADEWKPFKVFKILSILNGKGITSEEIEENPGDFIAVQSGEENNGVFGKINLAYCKKKNYVFSEKPCLTVARTGTAGYVSFQLFGCVVGDSAKILLLEDDNASINKYLFIQTVLMANRFKYAYGRKVTERTYKNDVINLPIVRNSDGTLFVDRTHKYSKQGYVPDWQFMENYIKALPYGDRI